MHVRLRNKSLVTAVVMALALLSIGLVPTAAAATIGSNSCTVVGSCDGATGPIGDNSCNATVACEHTTGAIGDNSCNGEEACGFAGTVGDNSCNATNACISKANVGDNSCNTSSGACLSASGAIGNCVYNDVQPAACATQPDALIRRIGRTTTVGGNIYNSTALNQTRVANLGSVKVARFVITIQNDSSVADSFTVHATGSSPCLTVLCLSASYPPGLTFYHGHPGTDITAAVDAGTFTTPTLLPGGVFRIRAVYYLASLPTVALTSAASLDNLVTVTSTGNPAQVDAVGFTINIQAPI